MNIVVEQANWISQFGDTVWHEYSGLARQYNSINLGQGFPGWSPPEFVLQALATANQAGFEFHQYAPPAGNGRLLQALCKLYSPLVGQELKTSQFQISSGASGGLWITTQALLNPGDNVIVVAPYFDIYQGDILARGANICEVPIIMPAGAKSTKEYKLDLEKLKQEVTKPEAKLLILNTPHNPTGKMFNRTELQEIADIVMKNDRLIVVTDEVYEFITFDGAKMERICTIPGMWDRTVNISSGGKFFSTTGWKIGWVYGKEELIQPIKNVNNFVTFAISHPTQVATAIVIESCLKPESTYFEELKAKYLELRDFMYDTLTEIGLHPVKPEGSFFIDCDISGIKLKEGQGTQKTITKQNLDIKDWNFCRWLTTDIGVAAIPCSAFYTGCRGPSETIRFAFCKPLSELQEARKRLLQIKNMHLDI